MASARQATGRRHTKPPTHGRLARNHALHPVSRKYKRPASRARCRFSSNGGQATACSSSSPLPTRRRGSERVSDAKTSRERRSSGPGCAVRPVGLRRIAVGRPPKCGLRLGRLGHRDARARTSRDDPVSRARLRPPNGAAQRRPIRRGRRWLPRCSWAARLFAISKYCARPAQGHKGERSGVPCARAP
jgi:hypothetical protein